MELPTDEETAARIREKCMTGDYEGDHGEADMIVIGLLRFLKYDETAKAWEAVGKWYA